MAVNVTEKDKTLNEIIDWCEQLAAEGLRLASALLRQHDMAAYGVVKGQVNAYEKTADLPFHARLHRQHAHGSTESKRGHEMSRTDTTDPDGLHFFRVKFNDAGEMYGLTQVTTD